MYGSSMSNPNPTFVFRMPAPNQRNKFELLKMQRSDFGEPNFPNITTKPIRIVDVSAEKETHVKSSLSEWQQLGLQGWSGELKPPVQWLEESHKDTTPKPPNWQLGAYPQDEILLDLQSYQLNGRVTDIRVMPSNQLEAQREDLMNEQNVYLARANDPFGYSMKWAFSNDTDQLKDRGKRDVAKLYSMIKCSTNCDPLIYKGYGCYCGFGGHGVPNDGIDRCCRLHDKCYGQSNCISYLEYFVPYVWKCYRGKPLCAIDHGEWGAPDSCAARLCQCDLRLSRCLRNFHCPSRRAVCRSSRSRRFQNLIFFD
ncbi:GH14304 [Drosophila grimshawi]|uniref:Phospholipase A2 n=2 Tax=Drosophila grimshawi TaxID=7222 RepID=B4JYJ0_DROGR|nr:GH14304 [Drosophila grimshawi]